MVYGYIKLIALNCLFNNPHTGYSLINAISLEINRKPSSGTIYPLLKSLLNENLVIMEPVGRKKIYSITNKGKIYLNKMLDKKEDLIISNLKLIHKFNNHLKSKECDKIHDLFIDDPNFISKKIKDWIGLRDLILQIILLPDYNKKKSKIIKLINDMTRKLKEIRDL